MMNGKTKNKRPVKIVIFGPDNAGKTTLAKTLEEEMWMDDFHYSHSPGPVSVEKMCEYIVDNLASDQNVIFDRFPVIEEMVCGNVLRGVDKFDQYRKKANDFLNKIDLFIFCNPGTKAITNWGTREQMDGVKENIDKLFQKYCELFQDLTEEGRNAMMYDWHNSKVENEKVKERIGELL